MFKKFAVISALAIAVLCGGCGPFWVDPYIAVKESHLNWVHIHYYNLNKKPVRRISVYINGAGFVELKKGTSELVSNDFAKGHESESWRDMKTMKTSTPAKHANDIFQNLVNYGLLDRDKYNRKSKKEKFDRFIAVKANISNLTYSEPENIFEVDPDLAEQLLDVIREFDNPAL